MNYLGSPRVSLATRRIAADAALALADALIHCEVVMTGTTDQQNDARIYAEHCKGKLDTACLMASIEYHATA